MSSLYSELTNLFDQDFMSFEEGKPIFDWLNRHQEDISNIETDYLNDISTALEKVADLEHRLSNCIETKFKQGDKCYGIIDTFAYTDVFPVEIRNTHLLYEVWDGEDTTKQHSTRIFATEEEAKAKLEELKNG